MKKIGIIANPVSARDIRRVISHAGNLPINDRANIVLRMLAALGATGVEDVLMMPENSGIRFHLMRSIERERKMGHHGFPRVSYIDMPVTMTATDSARAAKIMAEQDVAAIIVLGGDGTHRVVIQACADIPIAGVSTGTNNAFPDLREPTITGLAVGLAATGKVPAEQAYVQNKWLEISVNGDRHIALVDMAVVDDRFVGARAIWKTQSFRDLFVTFGLPGAIGMSSIAGLIDPVDRNQPEGRHIVLSPDADRFLSAPIAPGLIEKVGIQSITPMTPDSVHSPSIVAGTLAFDGEREVTFDQDDDISVRLVTNAFRTIDVPGCMRFAARTGLFIQTRN
ncbi:NAD(+)/NADH kinase [uncultured Thalassospira sp.]|uniref:ATP-NAD kinase family protein n=1 Tax=uncultured Thalassospira sp. TaxID=404382 RepID=UPI0030D868F6